jgi:hypothetical protein
MVTQKRKTKKNTKKNTKKHIKTGKKTENGVTKTKINPDSCNPANNNSSSCFDFEALVKIAKSWNKDHPKSEDKIKIPVRDNHKNKKTLWNHIDRKLRGTCTTEWCWIEQDFVRKVGNSELEALFRPKMPRSWRKNKYEWLSSIDIESVMSQYEGKYPDFKFIGPVPIDFDYQYEFGKCIVNELCKINLKNLLKRKITKVGIIFNLDKHDQPGSHWVAMYMDLNKKVVYYFDSYGSSPPSEVQVLIERLQEQSEELGFELKYDYSKIRHQYENSECGVYSIYFITQLLEEKKTFSSMQKHRISDKVVNDKRNYFFINPVQQLKTNPT